MKAMPAAPARAGCCPYLDTAGVPGEAGRPRRGARCLAIERAPVSPQHQAVFCLSDRHAECSRYRPPQEGSALGGAIRNDTGVFEGAEISMFYDPMIAKLVTHAATREAAIDLQADALDTFVIDGVEHNIPFLATLMQHPRWREGRLSTGFIAEEFKGGFKARLPQGEELQLLAAVGYWRYTPSSEAGPLLKAATTDLEVTDSTPGRTRDVFLYLHNHSGKPMRILGLGGC